MNKKFRIIITVGLTLAAGVANMVAVRTAVAQSEAARVEAIQRFGGEVVDVLVAKQDLKAGEELTAQNTEKKRWLADMIPQGAYQSLDELESLELSNPVTRGLPICAIHTQASSQLLSVPDNMMALAFPLNDKLGIPSNVGRGTLMSAYSVTESSSTLIAAEVKLLSDPAQAKTVTLACAPQAVEALLNAQAKGQLRFVMPSDTVRLEMESTTKDTSVSVNSSDAEKTAAPDKVAQAAPSEAPQSVPADTSSSDAHQPPATTAQQP